MSIQDDVNTGKYTTTLPYPERLKTPAILLIRMVDLPPDHVDVAHRALQGHTAAQEAYVIAKRAYHDDEHRLLATFRADLEAENGMTGHPKADKVWNKAWEDGHSSGLYEVAGVYAELAELVL